MTWEWDRCHRCKAAVQHFPRKAIKQKTRRRTKWKEWWKSEKYYNAGKHSQIDNNNKITKQKIYKECEHFNALECAWVHIRLWSWVLHLRFSKCVCECVTCTNAHVFWFACLRSAFTHSFKLSLSLSLSPIYKKSERLSYLNLMVGNPGITNESSSFSARIHFFLFFYILYVMILLLLLVLLYIDFFFFPLFIYPV